MSVVVRTLEITPADFDIEGDTSVGVGGRATPTCGELIKIPAAPIFGAPAASTLEAPLPFPERERHGDDGEGLDGHKDGEGERGREGEDAISANVDRRRFAIAVAPTLSLHVTAASSPAESDTTANTALRRWSIEAFGDTCGTCNLSVSPPTGHGSSASSPFSKRRLPWSIVTGGDIVLFPSGSRLLIDFRARS